jgi:iron(III) transport system substrate-binding protein
VRLPRHQPASRTARGPRRAAGLAVALSVLAAGLAACGNGGDRLTIYSGRTQELIGPLLEQYAEESGTSIDVRYADSAELALLIDTEGDRSPADVFISQSPGAVSFLDEQGRLQPLPDDLLERVPDEDRAANGGWVGLTGRVRTLAYNTDAVDESELPDSVLDLTDDAYRGRLGVAPSNGSFQDFVTAMRVERGDDATLEWLEGIAANDPRTYPNNVSILEAVGRGEIDMGLINHYYDFQAKAEDPDLPTALHFFDDGDLGGLLLVTAASVVDTAEQTEDARGLVEFLLEREAQEYFSDETLECPLAAGVDPAPVLPPLDSVARARIDFEQLGGIDRTVELIDESGISE